MIRNYEKCEFCRDQGCQYFCEETAAGTPGCIVSSANKICPYSAKQFHAWLKSKGFDIIRKVV